VSGIAGVVLPVDSIDEFSAQTQSCPEAGRSAGGTVNVVTKAGGNAFHGSLYYYNRNEFYGAASPFKPSGTKKPPVRNENYGFTVGGPFVKNKTFFFAGYEKQQYFIGLSGLATEPSADWVKAAGDLLSANGIPVSQTSCNLLGSLTSELASPCTNTGLWPTSGTGSIASLPATLNNFFSPIAATGYSYNGVARIDHNFTDKHHLYVRWFGGQGSQTQPLGGSAALGTASSNLKDYFEVAPLHVYNGSAVLNSTISPKLTNQVLFGANYFNQIFHDFGNGFNTKTLGLFLSPDATNKGQYILGAPNLQISGFENIGLTPPEGRSDFTWHVSDIISYSLGAHQLRFGAEVRQAHLNEFYHRRGLGSFTFDGSQGPWNCSDPVCALADFLAGDVSSSSIAVGDPERNVIVNAFNLYFQDSWQVTKRLNFNYGLRYEYFGPLHSQRQDIANFIPGTGFKVTGKGPLFESDKNNLAPRLGFAYQVNQKGDLIVRGGIGMFYDQINLNPFLDFRPPISASQGIEGNAFGPKPVSTYQTDFCGETSYNWSAVQVPGQVCAVGTPNAGQVNTAGSVFAGVAGCADPNCAAPGDPKGLSAYSVNQNFRTPYFYNYSLQIEKGFGSTAVFQIGYVGSQGRKLNIVSNINQNGDFANFGNILQLNTIGTSNYNSLQTTFRFRSWHGLTATFGYTWAHALDEITAYRAAILDDAFNRKLDYGNGDFDNRHLFTASYTYTIPKAPWAKGWSDYLVNGWELTSLWNFHTGNPSDQTRLGLDVIGDPYKGVDHKFSAGVQWWNPAAFAAPAPGTIGNLSRNKFYGPGYADVDFSIFKNIPVTERVKIQLRAEMYNLTNRINLSQGIGALGTSCGAANPNSLVQADRVCTAKSGFGFVGDTAGDFFGAPGIGPGEAFGMTLVAKIIF